MVEECPLLPQDIHRPNFGVSRLELAFFLLYYLLNRYPASLSFPHQKSYFSNIMLGKRKRTAMPMRPNKMKEPSENQTDHRQLFRQYFESRFQPLSEAEVPTPSLIEGSDLEDSESGESEWQGFSEDCRRSSPSIQVIEHGRPSMSDDADNVHRSEARSFMASPKFSRTLFS